MPTLIACLSSGKGSWSEVSKIIAQGGWNKVFLITNAFGKEKFQPAANTELIVINDFLEIPDLVKEIKKNLQGKIVDFEIALNLISGAGKEHMAVLEAVLELGLNFRLVGLKNGNLDVLGLER
ncbi:MAG TPA: hypothetical protein VJA23_02725 [Candidatus Nanoarchaeia archaeon]|nr:hypothetical protein [Candidatus Nanoarchaeia archaeon]